MIYYIYHWYGDLKDLNIDGLFKHPFRKVTPKTNVGTKKNPKWTKPTEEMVELDAINLPTLVDLQNFILKNGAIIIKPPKEKFPNWSIIVTKDDSFSQR